MPPRRRCRRRHRRARGAWRRLWRSGRRAPDAVLALAALARSGLRDEHSRGRRPLPLDFPGHGRRDHDGRRPSEGVRDAQFGRRVLSPRGSSFDESRRRRGCDVDIPWRRVDAAAATWIFRGDKSRRAAAAATRILLGDESRLRRGYSVETNRSPQVPRGRRPTGDDAGARSAGRLRRRQRHWVLRPAQRVGVVLARERPRRRRPRVRLRADDDVALRGRLHAKGRWPHRGLGHRVAGRAAVGLSDDGAARWPSGPPGVAATPRPRAGS